jgi:Matrixin
VSHAETNPMRLRSAAILVAALIAVATVSTAGAFTLEGGRWPTTTITYFNEVPAYSWAVDTAAYAWNTSGARVRFLKTSKANADVLIGIRWFKKAGDANIQRINGRFVGAKVGIRTGQDRYTMALVVTHELGHVLGLDHEDRACATMNSYLVNNGPEHCPTAPEGTWVCRLLRTDDVRGAVSLYGGTVKPIRGSEFCTK